MKIVITRDIVSNGKDKKCYAKRGEELNVLKDYGDGSYLVKATENIIVWEKNNNFKFI